MLQITSKRQLNVEVDPLDKAPGIVFMGASHEDLPSVEVLVIESGKKPSLPDIRSAYKWRRNNQNRPVVVAICHKDQVLLYGPAEDRQPLEIPSGMLSRVLQSALDEPNPLLASRNLVNFFDGYGSSDLSGVKNKGLFASHHLRDNLPQRKDWAELNKAGKDLATKRNRLLIEALGFTVAGEERNTQILKIGNENRVIAILLEDADHFDSPSGRFPSTPVSWGLSVAADHNIPWLIVIKKDQIRLHPSRDGVGVGQKGQAETFLELNLAQLDDENLALLPLIFSAASLARDGEVQKILDESSKYAAILGTRLRERVYAHVVPNISIAVAKKLQKQGVPLDSDGLQKAYSMTLRILFRLLFQAYAEDRGLLPAGRNEGYDANSLKTIAKRDIDAKPEDFSEVINLWHDLVQVWDAIDEGNPRWQVPAYNGGLFGRDPERHPEGAQIKTLELPDSVLGPALQALLIDLTEDGVRGPVDFRSLSVREFGTIYEGLLESSLSLAEVDLTVDNKDAWVPAKAGDAVLAKAGEPYFHSASGERKATGSYFTPKFVVDHLVEKAIDPTIDKHLEKIAGYLKAGDQATAGREFFDFRVADIAMGSAHFLVAAIDRIEAKMRSFLADPANAVPGVLNELQRLRVAATKALQGDQVAVDEIEDSSLLRRQIARRCIYGLDINPMAVELARLAIWIHTFVPGLPMSSLNHNLVCANSLTGIGSIDEALDELIPNRKNQPTLFDDAIYASLEQAKTLLIDAANASEADKAEVDAAAVLAREARLSAEPALLMFDAAIAARLELVNPLSFFSEKDILDTASLPQVAGAISKLNPAHMPSIYPEVFLRDNPGFDVLIGNPPWEKIKIEEHQWWGLRIPGLRGMPMAQRDQTLQNFRLQRPDLEREYEAQIKVVGEMRTAIVKGPLREGEKSGDPDLYQAFAWRNWQLARRGGNISLVLPRTAMSNQGLKSWRQKVLEEGEFESVISASNNRHWIFENIDARYTVVFATICKAKGSFVRFGGPFLNTKEFETNRNHLAEVPVTEFASWSETISFPAIPTTNSLGLFLKIKSKPSFRDNRNDIDFDFTIDLHASKDRALFNTGASAADGLCPVFSGASFNLWDPGFGPPYGYGSSQALVEFRSNRILSGLTTTRSAYFGMSPTSDYLEGNKPRIAIRAISNATNSRTIIVALIPPNVVCTHQANILVNKTESPEAEAYVLGIMSSIPYDWYARRLAELSVSLEMLRDSPIPLMTENVVLVNRVIQIAGILGSVDERYDKWSHELGIDKLTNSKPREDLMAELDAVVSLLYELTSLEVSTIFETFHRGWDYKPRLEKVLEYYDYWKDK